VRRRCVLTGARGLHGQRLHGLVAVRGLSWRWRTLSELACAACCVAAAFSRRAWPARPAARGVDAGALPVERGLLLVRRAARVARVQMAFGPGARPSRFCCLCLKSFRALLEIVRGSICRAPSVWPAKHVECTPLPCVHSVVLASLLYRSVLLARFFYAPFHARIAQPFALALSPLLARLFS
jgi:hypothetical protein